MLTTCLLLLSMTSWAQEAAEDAPSTDSPEPEAASEEASEVPASTEDAEASDEPAVTPPFDGGAERPPPPVRRSPPRPGMQRQAKAVRCESWEIAVWNPRKSGCAAQPDALGEEWCPVPAGMTPVQPVGDTNKWWVKRCAEPVGGGGPPQPPTGG